MLNAKNRYNYGSVFGLISTPIVVYVTRWYDIGKLFERWLPTVVFAIGIVALFCGYLEREILTYHSTFPVSDTLATRIRDGYCT